MYFFGFNYSYHTANAQKIPDLVKGNKPLFAEQVPGTFNNIDYQLEAVLENYV